MKKFLYLLFLLTTASCYDKNIIDDVNLNDHFETNLIYESIGSISMQSDEMGTINIESVNYAFELNTVNLTWGNSEVATVYFDPEKYSIVIKKLTGLQFELIMDNDNQKISFKHDNTQREFNFTNEGWMDSKTGKILEKNWYSNLNINPKDLVIIPHLLNEIEDSNPYSHTKRRQTFYSNLIIEKQLRLSEHEYTPLVAPNCEFLCRSDIIFDWTASFGCYNANADVNSRCCSNQWCIGCCEMIGCDCIGLIGDYFVGCTAKGFSCSGNPHVIID